MAGFQMTLSSFRLNDGLPICPFHRRGIGIQQEPGRFVFFLSHMFPGEQTHTLDAGLVSVHRYQQSDGSFGPTTLNANRYSGIAPGTIGMHKENGDDVASYSHQEEARHQGCDS